MITLICWLIQAALVLRFGWPAKARLYASPSAAPRAWRAIGSIGGLVVAVAIIRVQ